MLLPDTPQCLLSEAAMAPSAGRVRAGAVLWQVGLLPVPPGLVSTQGVPGHSREAAPGCQWLCVLLGQLWQLLPQLQ